MLIRAVNVVASLLGHPIHWDTETVGCNPSLSSIPVTMQRSFADALAELSTWLALPENKDEFIVVFLDDQMDLQQWVWHLLSFLERANSLCSPDCSSASLMGFCGCFRNIDVVSNLYASYVMWLQGFLPQLLKEIQDGFPVGSIYTPPDHAKHGGVSWPSIDDLLLDGKRIMFVSGEDYGPAMAPLIFERNNGTVCGWQVQYTQHPLGVQPCVSLYNHHLCQTLFVCRLSCMGCVCAVQEPPLSDFDGTTDCVADRRPLFPGNRHTLTGTLFRVTTCELLYGPLNCDFVWKSDNLCVPLWLMKQHIASLIFSAPLSSQSCPSVSHAISA